MININNEKAFLKITDSPSIIEKLFFGIVAFICIFGPVTLIHNSSITGIICFIGIGMAFLFIYAIFEKTVFLIFLDKTIEQTYSVGFLWKPSSKSFSLKDRFLTIEERWESDEEGYMIRKYDITVNDKTGKLFLLESFLKNDDAVLVKTEIERFIAKN
jgi:hypothetical protein